MAPLHSVTNLRTPARRGAGDAAPAVDDLLKFTIPKLKQPAAQSARKAAQQPSGDNFTGQAPESAGWQLSQTAPQQLQLGPDASHTQQAAGDGSYHAGQEHTAQRADRLSAGQPEVVGEHASTAVSGLAGPDTSLLATAKAGVASRPGIPPSGRALQGIGTRRLLPQGGQAARRRTSHAPAAVKTEVSKAGTPAAQQLPPASQLPSAAATEAAFEPHGAEAASGPGVCEQRDANSPQRMTSPPPRSEDLVAHTPASQPPARQPHTPAAAAEAQVPAEDWTPAAPHSTQTPLADTPVSRYADAVSDGSDEDAGLGGSPEYCPTGERRATPQDADSADERLSCQSPIVTRRGRRTSAAVVQRFGDWYNGDDGELDKALLDYNRLREREAAQRGADSAARTAKAAASRRKSALPVMVETPVSTEAAAAEKAGRRAARQRRTTLAPGQDTAAAVAAMSEQLTDLADRLLPGKEADRPSKPSAPLRQRLQQSWQGKSYYDRLRDIAEESEEELASPQRRRKSASEAPVPTPQPASRPDSTAASAEQPLAQPQAGCLNRAVATIASIDADGRPRAAQAMPQQAATEQKQKRQPGKKAAHRREKMADPAASLPAPPVAAGSVATVQVQTEPEAGQITQLQAELQQLRHDAAQAELRHAADVATIATELEAARLAAAAEAQKADNEAADTARRLQAADGEVQALLAKLQSVSAANATAAAAEAQARGRTDSRAAAKLKEVQAGAEKKAAALQTEREARRAAEAKLADAEAARQADGRLRRAAEKKAKDLEAKLDAQTKRTQEAMAKADGTRNMAKASAAAIATLEAQLAGLQAAAAAQVAAVATLAEQTMSAVSSGAAVRKALAAC